MANPDLRENVLLNLRSVTQSIKGGVPFERLQRDYKDLLGSPIPFRDLGYNSLEAFIRDIPHVIALKKNNAGQLMAEGVADASTAHIVSLVSRQKTDTKKKPFRRPPPQYGMRKPLSSRFTFREGSRGHHSHYAPSNQYTKPSSAKSFPKPSLSKPKPARISPPPTAPPPKPRAPPEQVPIRKYEVPPRFLKSKEVKESKETKIDVSPPPVVSSPVLTYSSFSQEREPKIIPPPIAYESEPKIIPPPTTYGRSLPSKPSSNYRATQMNALESAKTAKEYIEIYSKMRNLSPVYCTVLLGQKAKSKGYVSTLKLGDKSYRSYPDMKPTEELAEEEAAKKAMSSIKEQREDLNSLPETPYSSADDIRILLSRIEEIVYVKPSGMFANGIVREYEEKFSERLPSCWPELLKQCSYLEVEELKVSCGKVPEGANIIVRPTKELSSGNQTPSSTSSKTEYTYEDLDTKALKKSLSDISQAKVPEFMIPIGNIWDVYVTNVSGWFSARLLDFSDAFLQLSEEMSQFYKLRSFPVVEVYECLVYAACLDDNPNIWHRVIAEEVKEDGQISCYFVDEGDFSYVRAENLQEMSPSFLKLPFQAIHLSLDGLDEYEKCIRSDILENSLLGKTLIAEVKRCQPIPDFFPNISGIHRMVYSVILYDTSNPSGEDINLNDELKKSAIESLNCKLPKLATSSCAYLSHVTPEGYVYLRLTNPEECWIEQELIRLSPEFEDASLATNEIPFQSICAAKFESGSWHRAIVTGSYDASVDPEEVEVFYVDFGHAGVVGKSEICELKPISEILATVPYQVFCCELLNALPSPKSHWTELATAKLLELAPFNQELIIRVMSEEDENNRAKVNLYKRNKDSNIISINLTLSCDPTLFDEDPIPAPIKAPTVLPLRQKVTQKNSLVNNLSGVIPDVARPAEEYMAKKLGTSISTEKIEWPNTPDDIKSPDAFEIKSPASLNLPAVPEKGEYFDVFVTMAANPHVFVVQPFSCCPSLEDMMKEMLNFYSTEENLMEMDVSMITKNGYYAALHSDNNWYRVRIKQIFNSDEITVYYVDFGDFNRVSINKLQPLYDKFKQLPRLAINASLAGIKPYDGDWDPVHCVKFQEMISEKSFVSFICKKQVKTEEDIPSLHVELFLVDTSDSNKDVYIHETLIEKKVAKVQ